MNLNQVTLPALDIEQSVRFYKGLGLTQIVEDKHYARFITKGEGTTLSLLQSDVPATNGAVIYFEVEDVDLVYCRLTEVGFIFDSAPVTEDYLWRECSLTDPSGNKIKIYFAGGNRLSPPWIIRKDAG